MSRQRVRRKLDAPEVLELADLNLAAATRAIARWRSEYQLEAPTA